MTGKGAPGGHGGEAEHDAVAAGSAMKFAGGLGDSEAGGSDADEGGADGFTYCMMPP
jgi:hypothetical protein